ncbi:hypothetical protein A0H81_07205 [Grifola frondosa]|uniref:Uncharacterized protein n=1 Tax=Grifola frondosa TaxID=5627 RepID=A0A1C7M822_GRIFR|nr:hypothetical protein A0H81_07205 [Grifola frondosa]
MPRTDDGNYHCNCEEQCRGLWGIVSLRTHSRHKHLRVDNDRSRATWQDYLNHTGREEWQGSIRRTRRAADTSVAEHPTIGSGQLVSVTHEEAAMGQDLGNMNIDLPEPNFPESTDESQDDEDDNEQEEELLEEEMMGPEFQMSIDELATLDLNEASADIHSIFAQTQEDHQADTSVSNDEEDPIEITVENIKSEVDDIRIAEEFREQLRTAQLEKSGLSEQDIFRLRNPEEAELDIDDPILRLSLDIFLAVSNASEQTYTDVRDALMRYHPPAKSTHTTKSKGWSGTLRVAEVAIQELQNTGQLQEYTDLFHGVDILEAIAENRIRGGHASFQIVGCISGWFLTMPQTSRYKKEHIIPGGVIPGPSKPKNLDSFLFPGLYHIAALQNEGGVWLWDALIKSKYQSRPFLALATADSCYGYDQKVEKGEWQSLLSACLKPLDQDVPGSNHDDINIYNVQPESLKETSERYELNLKYLCESTERNYKSRRLETGICKPSIFSGLDPRIVFPFQPYFQPTSCTLHHSTSLISWLASGGEQCPGDNNDNIRSWDFAVLRDPTLWSLHGQEVAAATHIFQGHLIAHLVILQRKSIADTKLLNI